MMRFTLQSSALLFLVAILSADGAGFLDCEAGRTALCACPPSLDASLCRASSPSCLASVCRACLTTAWAPRVSVDCSAPAARGWSGCAAFAAGMAGEGGAAIAAQLSYYTCSRVLRCCGADHSEAVAHAEAALYVDYPRRALPVPACSSRSGGGGGGGSGTADACRACEAATSVSLALDASRCGAAHASAGFPPTALAERCQYVQDVVREAAPELVPALSDAVCACAGCCPAEEGGKPRCLLESDAVDEWLADLAEGRRTGHAPGVRAAPPPLLSEYDVLDAE